MKLEYYENPNYIFISWNEDCDGEYRISPFGYVPEKGMTEYFVTSDSVEFIFSKNGIQQDALVFNRPSVQWDVSKQNSFLMDEENPGINNFIEIDELQKNYDAAMIMPYAAPAPPPPQPGPSPYKTIIVTWTVNNVEKLVINEMEITGKALQKRSVCMKLDPSVASITLKAYAACGYYICEQRGI